jgi:glucuronokinase
MLILRKRAHARAGVVGNPSDGYHGKTISVIVRNFFAEVVLYEWDDVELVLSEGDRSRFRSVQDLARDVKLHGYYGGIRLVKAAVKKFVEYCQQQGHALHGRNFSVRYETNIPRGVGLSGSSAIIVATLRCLMDFYQVDIPREVQPSLALAVEKEELGIAAGLQDRVAQVYEGVTYMDFAREQMRKQNGYLRGVYQPLDPALLPPLYVAYSREDVEGASERIETSNVVHSNIRVRFEQGEKEVVEAMQQFARLAAEGREAILARDADRLASLINRNFDLRRSIYRQMLRGQIEMVEVARGVGASAHFAGSGGAILGTYRDEPMYEALRQALGNINCVVLKPQITAAPSRP